MRMLHKLATEDVFEETNDEFRRIRGENKKYLNTLFSSVNAYTSGANKEIKKLFPGRTSKEGGGQLLKVARFTYTFAMKNTPFIKEASPNYHEVMFFGFRSELEKIAAVPYGRVTGVAGKTLGAARRPLPLSAPKVYHISETGSPMGVSDLAPRVGGGSGGGSPLAPGVIAMRARPKPGFFGRMFGAT